MNRFFKPALTLLLELKLGDCPISRRLDPIVTFLTRHCKALKQHLYPECFQILIQILWKLILQVFVYCDHIILYLVCVCVCIVTILYCI